MRRLLCGEDGGTVSALPTAPDLIAAPLQAAVHDLSFTATMYANHVYILTYSCKKDQWKNDCGLVENQTKTPA